MKVLYLTIAETSPGVQKKLTDKTNSLRLAGLDVHFCSIGSLENRDEAHTTHIHVDQSVARRIGKWFFIWRLAVFFEQRNLYRAAYRFVKSHPADIILFRYPVSDFFLWRFMKRCKLPVVFEYNSIELYELNMRRKEFFYFQYFYWSERLFGRWVRKRSAGIIGVTPEITSYQSALANNRVPFITISNGINVARVKQKENTALGNGHINLLLLAGSQAKWHGVDILLRSLGTLPSEHKVSCYIAGNVSDKQREVIANLGNCHLLPGVFGEDLDNLVNQCHVGIGSLGFETSFLTQAAPLKVREYWARGLPFVIAYEDADLIQNEEMIPYFLNCTVQEGCIDLQQIDHFANQVYAIPNVAEKLRATAFKYIDYEVKAKQYVTFLNSVLP
jgi:hypothetical protein